MENFDEALCLMAMNSLFGAAPRTGLGIIGRAGSAAAVFEMGEKALKDLLENREDLSSRILGFDLESSAKELERIRAMGHGFTGITLPDYPPLLREITDPPIGLYYSAATPLTEVFGTRPAVAIVGTRDMTAYGREWCIRIVKALSNAIVKPLIISGLALGTDITAHRAALGFGLHTAAVLPVGIDSIYPARHWGYAREIRADSGSAIVTDYPPGTFPAAYNFVRRNRIIAGLSKAVILTESKIKGGGMITMRFASDYSRDGYALPGRVDDRCSQGCNLLIRNKLAEAITDTDDLVGKLGLGLSPAGREDPVELARKQLQNRLGEDRMGTVSKVLEAIRDCRGIDADRICHETSLGYETVSECLVILESEGIISVDILQRCSLNPKNS